MGVVSGRVEIRREPVIYGRNKVGLGNGVPLCVGDRHLVLRFRELSRAAKSKHEVLLISKGDARNGLEVTTMYFSSGQSLLGVHPRSAGSLTFTGTNGSSGG